jgi:hypothetical protein
MISNKTIETTTATYYIENDILVVRTKPGAEYSLKEVMEGFEARKKLQQSKQMLTLVDTREVFQVTREAREYGAKKEVEDLSIAMAILSGNSMAATIIGNFFIKFNKPSVPTKMFKSEEKALNWLLGFK